jgi:hypothetical protein
MGVALWLSAKADKQQPPGKLRRGAVTLIVIEITAGAADSAFRLSSDAAGCCGFGHFSFEKHWASESSSD